MNPRISHAHAPLCAVTITILLLTLPAITFAQGGQRRGGPPPVPKEAAPFDMAGYWVSIITEDWHVRMLTPPKGDFGSGTNVEGLPFGGDGNIPYNPEGNRIGKSWDPAKDLAEGNQCKGYGAGGVMRLPGRLHITWEDDYTLRVDTDAGMQTRLFRFARPQAQGGPVVLQTQPPGPSLQGNSVAEWIIIGGRGDWARGGNLKVVTKNLRPGYYWKNGMPYSGDTTLTEHYRITKEPNGDVWLNFSMMAEDPQYLKEPWIVTYHFKKEPDGSKWTPLPCSVK